MGTNTSVSKFVCFGPFESAMTLIVVSEDETVEDVFESVAGEVAELDVELFSHDDVEVLEDGELTAVVVGVIE